MSKSRSKHNILFSISLNSVFYLLIFFSFKKDNRDKDRGEKEKNILKYVKPEIEIFIRIWFINNESERTLNTEKENLKRHADRNQNACTKISALTIPAY